MEGILAFLAVVRSRGSGPFCGRQLPGLAPPISLDSRLARSWGTVTGWEFVICPPETRPGAMLGSTWLRDLAFRKSRGARPGCGASWGMVRKQRFGCYARRRIREACVKRECSGRRATAPE